MSDDVEHTPGPWIPTRDAKEVFARSAYAEVTIAEIQRPFPSEVYMANARLIAAAPDLLDGLNKAYDELYKIDHLTEVEVPQSLMQKLQDILDKAEGRNE